MGPCEAIYACCAKIEELDLASGLKQLQFLSRYQRDFAKNAGSNCPKWMSLLINEDFRSRSRHAKKITTPVRSADLRAPDNGIYALLQQAGI
ncbi:MAG: hypothetical protein SRB2_03846 [Desulfobacteraceae bacterium Eth-SRB2]|nr:MAG: hypothetical protein SRB2_03846 [Desulfobacteraceae bacterium Eth-SRB2]